jgi:hypothetical protein
VRGREGSEICETVVNCEKEARFSKFWLSSSLRSLHNQNATQKMAMPLFALPTRHPIQKECATLTKQKTEN